MEQETFDKSIRTRKLQLVGFSANFTHFLLVFYLLMGSSSALIYWLVGCFQNSPDIYPERTVQIMIIILPLAAIVYLIQRRRLRFRVVKTNLTHVQLKKIIAEVAKQLGWMYMSSTPNYYIAKTNPGFFSGSWGEQITILFYQDSVLINSICDPDRHSSLVSWGRNKKNEDAFINKIFDANQTSNSQEL